MMMANIARLAEIREKVELSAEAIKLIVKIAPGEIEDPGPSEELEVVEDPMEAHSMTVIETENNATLKRKNG